MTLRPDDDISEIRQQLEELRQASWLGSARQWWPLCLFHCTDISNVISILQEGELLSRVQAKKAGQLKVDIASPEVIAGTHSDWQDYVRLYFRPRTPTQYGNEGLRPSNRQRWNAHCPVPVYLIFNSIDVLSRSDCLFSDGNLGSGYSAVENKVSFLKDIPFDKVYHDTWFNPEQRDTIVHHRNAEVLVPQRMALDSLLFIGCRSDAEFKTLLHSLRPEVLPLWVDKIGFRPRLHLFNRKWTFVEYVEMSTDCITFHFNRNSISPGPFEARVEISETVSGQRYIWSNTDYNCDRLLQLPLQNLKDSSGYSVRLFLDDHLAFANRFKEDDLPF